MTSLVNFFAMVLLLLSSLVTGPSAMSISSLFLELWQFSFIRNWREVHNIKNTTVFPNIWRLGWVRDTKFGTSVSNEMLLNAAKCKVYSFYGFWVIMGKLTCAGGNELPIQIKSISSFDILDSSNQNPFVNIIFKLTITVKNYSK